MVGYNKAAENKHRLPWSLPQRRVVLLCSECKLTGHLESRRHFKTGNSKVRRMCHFPKQPPVDYCTSHRCRTCCSWHRCSSCRAGTLRQAACRGIVYEQGSACRSCNFGGFVCVLVMGAAFLITLRLLLLA